MSPNRTIVAVLVALMVGQVAAGLASAQSVPSGSDVIVDVVEVGTPRIADIPATINITIRNVGTEDFQPPTGWRIFVGLNGQTEDACITSQSGSIPSPFPQCYIQVRPGSEGYVVARNGGTQTFRLTWNADPSDVNASAFLWIEILAPTETPGTPNDCQGVDGECENNGRMVTGVRIDRLGVRAYPDRDAREGTGLDANDAWRVSDIPADRTCPLGTGSNPQNVRVGCRTVPGATLLASFFVNNTGTIEDTYVPEITPNSALQDFLERGYAFEFAPTAIRVNPGQSQVARMSITIPHNETAFEGLNIGETELSVLWRSVTLNTLTTGTPTPMNVCETACENPTLPTFIVGPRYQFNLTTNYTYDDTLPAETSEFRINLTNLGNIADTYNVSFVTDSRTINDSWSPTIEASPYLGTTGATFDPLGVGANHSVRIFVTPPPKTTNGTYWFDVAVKSRGDTQNAAACKYWEGIGPDQARVTGTGPECRVRFTVNVRQTWNISGTTDLPRREVPGKTVTYNLVIRNDGNGYDNLTLNLASSVAGWDARLSTPTLSLSPGNASTFQLTVTAPPNLPENTQAAFFVNATSSGPGDRALSERSNVSLMSLYTVGRGPNIRLDAATTRAFVDPGQTVNFSVTATNIGNVADNFTVPLPARPADWGVTVDPPFAVVEPGASFPITVSLRAPGSAVTGENATAALRVASTVDRSLDATIQLEGNISGPDLFVGDILTNTTAPYTGDPLEVTVNFGNSGNKPADRNMTLRVYFVRQGVEQLIGEKTYPAFNITAQRRLSETFVWDTSNVEGAGVLLARIDATNSVIEMDESAASNELTKSLTFRRFALRLDAAEGQEARPGEALKYEAPNAFTITYTGDDPEGEPVRVTVSSEHGWLTSRAEIFESVRPGTSLLVQPELQVPRLPGTSRDALTITVEPVRRPAELQRATVTTTVIDEEKPLVKAIVAAPTSARVGQSIVITADVEDATGVTSVTAYVTAPTNQTSALPMQLVAGKWVLNSTFPVAGEYRVTAEASDAADPPNRNTTRQTAGTFTMLPGPGPDIRLAAGQGTTIRTGSGVRVAITDAAGVAKASYSIRGVSYDLRGPDHTIDTSTFPNGAVEVNVTAENIHGVRSSTTFAFTVDNDAPQITRVALEPERPRAGDTVKLTITTQAETQGVTVALRRDGNLVETLNATRRSGGTYEVTFDAVEGDYRLDVTASDAAGNANLASGAVVFSARPGSPIPVPTWLPLLGLAAVALALTRRR